MYTYSKKINLPTKLITILTALKEEGIKPLLVGGCVRDYFLNLPIKDFDIELFSCENLNKVEEILSKFGKVKYVGKSFGVLILCLDGIDYDFALARREEKTGNKHSDFKVSHDKNMDFKEAALRRDFTINAIAYDYFENEFLDPFNGIKDLKNKTLKHINDKTFIEDALRVYRAVQFSARFDFNLDNKTFELCKTLVLSKEMEFLAKERIYEELKKLFLKSFKPSLGFSLMKDLGLLRFYPELEALIGCEQDKEYHPEGDVWIHTLMCLDELARILREEKIEDEYRKLYLFYGVLCHDLGKPFCTKEINGRITSYKHESLGVEPTISFLEKLTNEKKFIEIVCALVKNHLAPFQLYLAESSLKAVKRLSLKLNIEDLCLVCLADCLGRDIKDKQKCPKATSWLLNAAKELNIENKSIKPFVLGRDLIALGFKPSKEFKEILDFAFDLQIDESLEKEELIKRIKNKYLV